MASAQADKDFMKEQHSPDDVVSIDLPAPQGWTKKFTPRKGGTPRRNEIIFVSPTGEEIKNRSQLDRFLKSHPGGPSSSEFDWGTGDSPRRSARISGKSKAMDTPRTVPPRKKQTKSSSKEVKGKNDDTNGEGVVTEKQAPAAADETEASKEVEMKDVKDVANKSKVEVSAAENTANDSQLKSDEKIDEMDIGKLECQEVDNKTACDPKEETDEKLEGEPHILPKLENKEAVNKTEEEETGNKSLPESGQDEKKEEDEKQPAEPEAPVALPDPEKEGNVLKDAVPEVDAKVEKECEAKVGQEEKNPWEKEASTERGVVSGGEARSENERLREGEEVAKPSGSHTEAPHEPKASQVRC